MEKMITKTITKNTCMDYMACYVDAEEQQGTAGRETVTVLVLTCRASVHLGHDW